MEISQSDRKRIESSVMRARICAERALLSRDTETIYQELMQAYNWLHDAILIVTAIETGGDTQPLERNR